MLIQAATFLVDAARAILRTPCAARGTSERKDVPAPNKIIGRALRSKYKAVISAVYSFAISEEVVAQVVELENGWVSANPCSRIKGIPSVSDYEATVLEP